MRIIDKVEYLAHVNPIFKKLHLLKLSDICQQQIMVFVYKFTHNLLPINFSNYFFCAANDSHTHFTRHSSGLYIPFAKTDARQKSMKVVGPLSWNQLTVDIQQSVSLPVFKKKS